MTRRKQTSVERKADLLRDIQAKKDELAFLEAQDRERVRVQRLKDQAAVGKMVDDAGLLAYDLHTLKRLFTAVARVSHSDPRAVGEFLGLDAILHGEVDVITVVDEQGKPLVHEKEAQ